MPKPKSIPENQLVLVDKALSNDTENGYKKVPVNSLERRYENLPTRPKRELTEKQKENLARLIEMNKQRALERRGITTLPNGPPEVIPENKEVVQLVKRQYNRKPKNELPQETPQLRRESTSLNGVPPPIHIHIDREALGMKTKKKVSVPKAPKAPKAKKQPRSYYSDSNDDTKDESEDESEDETTDFDTDVEISKYNKKIQKRSQSLSALEKQINQLKQSNNPYAKHSVF